MIPNVHVHIGVTDLQSLIWRTLKRKWNQISKGFSLDAQTDVEMYDKNYV